jgi:pimeloyl-ACP methyl ester carboxylesterase
MCSASFGLATTPEQPVLASSDSVWGFEHFVKVSGTRIRVVQGGSGPPLLLINGIGASAEMWAPLAAQLSGHELVAFDLPGTGSSPPTVPPVRIRGLARIAELLLDELGYERADVLGYSFGGVVAQELARRAGEHVQRLVLCATGFGIGGVPPEPIPALVMLSPLRYYSPAAARRLLPLIAGGRSRRDPQALAGHLAERLANPPSLRGYMQQLYAISGWSSRSWLAEVRHQTLIMHGDDDPLVPVANAHRMAERMPNAHVHVVRGGGHLFLIDETESVIGPLSDFLSRN